MQIKKRKKFLTVTAKDCVWQTFRSGGKGGQNQNKRDTGVRVIHPPSGARGESRQHRTQLENKREAWKRMASTPAFDTWVKKMAGHDAIIDERVERDLREENLRLEVKDAEGRWVEVGFDELEGK